MMDIGMQACRHAGMPDALAAMAMAASDGALILAIGRAPCDGHGVHEYDGEAMASVVAMVLAMRGDGVGKRDW